MNPHGVNVFNKADRYHVIVCIPNNFQLQLFPAYDSLFNKYLSDEARSYTTAGNCFELFLVISDSSAPPSESIGRSYNHRVPQFVCNGQCLFDGIGRV